MSHPCREFWLYFFDTGTYMYQFTKYLLHSALSQPRFPIFFSLKFTLIYLFGCGILVNVLENG